MNLKTFYQIKILSLIEVYNQIVMKRKMRTKIKITKILINPKNHLIKIQKLLMILMILTILMILMITNIIKTLIIIIIKKLVFLNLRNLNHYHNWIILIQIMTVKPKIHPVKFKKQKIRPVKYKVQKLKQLDEDRFVYQTLVMTGQILRVMVDLLKL